MFATRFKTIIFVYLLHATTTAFAGNGYVFLSDTTSKLFYVSNNEVYTPDKKELLCFQKGNIFFKGTTDDRENIFLLTTSTNANSDNLEAIYEKDARQALYSFSKYKFYLGKPISEDVLQRNELIHIQPFKKWLAFYSSISDTLLAFYKADSLPSSTAVIMAYTLIKKFGLEKMIAVKKSQPQLMDGAYSTIKPAWGNQTANEWMWDGKIFRPRWDTDPNLAWTFDGQTIKPEYGNNIYAEYSWDGENFKQAWGTNQNIWWTWDGKIMKPIWDTDWADQYTIVDGEVKPWSNTHPEKEWKLDGDIPVPLIILVISGIARAN